MKECREIECRDGHPPDILIMGMEQSMCLGCFASLLTDSASLTTHRAYALSQFAQLLEDHVFCSTFLGCQHFLVRPLAEALCSCRDDQLAKGIVDITMQVCRLTVDDSTALLQDFLLHFSLQLGSDTVVWSRGQCYMLHVMGLMLELHSKYDAALPQTLKCQEMFLFNLVSALQLPGDELRGEVLFVMYKLSTLEGGMDAFLRYCPQIIHMALNALLKTESDELRTNCIALLTIMARNSVFDLKSESCEDESHGSQELEVVQKLVLPKTSGSNFLATFAEAMKGSLLSSDTQVQLSALQLICCSCPQDTDYNKELAVLVDEGVADFIFEMLRVSENIASIVVMAIRALNVLASAKVFRQRFIFGIEAVVRVLEHSLEVAFCTVQTDVLFLLANGISDCPGIISSSKAEHILLLLTKMFQQHANTVEDIRLSRSTKGNASTATYMSTCMVMIALLKLPCLSNIPSISEIIGKALTSIVASMSDDSLLLPDVLKFSACLFKESYIFSTKIPDLLSLLLELFEVQLLPVVSRDFERIDDEDTAAEVLDMITAILRETERGPAALQCAQKIASYSWLSLSFASTARFTSSCHVDTVLDFVAALVNVLDANEDIKNTVCPAILNLPTDPSDFLILLKQSSISNPDLVITHCAVVTILYASYMHKDRLIDAMEILASLQDFILLHGSRLNSAVYKHIFPQVLILYILIQHDSNFLGNSCNIETDNILVKIIMDAGYDYLMMSPQTPKPVIYWLLSQQPLQQMCMVQLRNWIMRPSFLAAIRDSSDSSHASCWSDLETMCDIVQYEHGAALVMCLLGKICTDQIDEDIEIVTKVLMRTMHSSSQVSEQLHKHGILLILQRWYIVRGSKASVSAFISCTEILIMLLCTVTPKSPHHEAWVDIVNQAIYLAMLRQENGSDKNTTDLCFLLTFLCLFMYKSYDVSFLCEVSEAIYKNKSLSTLLEGQMINASKAKATSRFSSNASSIPSSTVIENEQLLCLYVLFHYLCLLSNKQEPLQTNISYQQLFHLLRYGSRICRILSSACLCEKLTHGSLSSEVPLKPMIHLLLSSMLDDCEVLQVNAASCLLELIRKKGDTVICASLWYRLLMKETLRTLSTASSLTSLKSLNLKVKLALILLSTSTPTAATTSSTAAATITTSTSTATATYTTTVTATETATWMRSSVFTPVGIASAISNLPSIGLSCAILDLFIRLLKLGWLDKQHIQSLQAIFQEYRKTWYKMQQVPAEEKVKSGFVSSGFGGTIGGVINMIVSKCCTLNRDEHEDDDVIKHIDEFMQACNSV